MARVTRISPEIRAEAAAWLARLRADDKSVADEKAFRIWLSRDPQHEAAFEAVTEMWEIAGAAQTEPRLVASHSVTRRRAILASVSAMAAAGVYFSLRTGAYAAVYETAVGEQKHVVLTDGTQVFLDTDTRIQTTFDSEMRLIALERGRCNFHVMADDKRPFVVDAAAQRIVAARSVFDVQREGDDVCVVLLQGATSVSGRQRTDPRVLKAGERLMVRRNGSRIDKPSLVALFAWQSGQAVFENDSLGEAIHEMNRYSEVKLAAVDPAVASMRISGVYRVGDNIAFARSVSTLLPVAVQYGAGQVRFVVDQARVKGA
jgi:transmembrane sensor